MTVCQHCGEAIEWDGDYGAWFHIDADTATCRDMQFTAVPYRQPTPGGPVTMSDGCEEARQLERRLRWQHREVEEPDEPAAQPQEDT